MSVNEPKRSFCPGCEREIPWFRNLPIVTWLIQLGKCAGCGGKIASRYLLVEVLTAVLFVWAWMAFENPVTSLMMMAFGVTLLVSFFIDVEHMLIPVPMVWVTAVFGLVGGWFVPELVTMGGAGIWPGDRWMPLAGGLIGWGSLIFMVLLGKVLFGRKKIVFDDSVQWLLVDPDLDEDENAELTLRLDGEDYAWSELFYRTSDRLLMKTHGVDVNGKRERVTDLVMTRDAVFLGKKEVSIESLKSLRGKVDEVVIPREAMGGGDPPLLGMIGCFLGWPGVLFTIVASCVSAILFSLLSKVGLGRPLPYGPFLVIGAFLWILKGWEWWGIYMKANNLVF